MERVYIAVVCARDGGHDFDAFVQKLQLRGCEYAYRPAREFQVGNLLFCRVSTELDTQGCTFDGVVWLTTVDTQFFYAIERATKKSL
jgi:hypothetical protein